MTVCCPLSPSSDPSKPGAGLGSLLILLEMPQMQSQLFFFFESSFQRSEGLQKVLGPYIRDEPGSSGWVYTGM